MNNLKIRIKRKRKAARAPFGAGGALLSICFRARYLRLPELIMAKSLRSVTAEESTATK